MFHYINKGFHATLRQPFPVLVLFLYRFCWGIVLYKLCQSIVLPLLHRYPGDSGFESQTRLFLAEGQFVLLKTDISHSVIWLLAVLLVLRMVCTPLLNAGLFYSLSNTHFNAGYRFVRGIAEHWRSYTLLYAAKTALTLLPLWWISPKLQASFATAASYTDLAYGMLPQLGFLAVYSFLIHLLFVYLQFGRVQADSILRTLGTALRSLPLMLGISVLILLATALCSLAVLSSTIMWAGFWMLVVYQAYRFFQTLFSVWAIAAQHELYMTKAGWK
ncbi:MAG: hypothetical protein K0R57_4920 [Paenibacillaceae bacterium]|jgi:hypothetical protein|nr:hypothetical protein [Paenibacillaceae bacterium]